MFKDSKEIYEFAQFRLEVTERRLTRNGRITRLADKAFDTLCVLVRQRGKLVTKDELMSAVWPDSVVEENNLDQKISILRGILGDRGKGKEKFIETVRGHGYRFIPDVKAISDLGLSEPGRGHARPNVYSGERPSGAETPALSTWNAGNAVAIPALQYPSENESSSISSIGPFSEQEGNRDSPSADVSLGTRSAGRRMFLQLGVALAILFSFIAIAWTSMSPFPKRPPSASQIIETIAVLPFSNETGDVENDYLADGLTESMIGSLSQVPGLSVKARSSVFRYKGKEINAEIVGRELSAQGILMGLLTLHGDNLTLSLELVDSTTGNAIWSERYDRKVSLLVDLQTEIAHDVSIKLRDQLSKPDQLRITRTFTANPEANRLYFQGLYHWNKRTAEDLRKSISLFQQAIEIDPSYAKAYAWLALAYMILPDYSHNLTRDEVRDLESKRRSAMERAQQLDGSLAEVHVLSATLKEDVDWDFAGAEKEYRRAIELNPSFATAYQAYSRMLGAHGRHEEALLAISKAVELDPFSRSIAFNLGGRLAEARRFDEAIAQYKRVLEMEPDHPLTHLVLAYAYDAKGMFPEAISAYQVADVLLEKETPEAAGRKAADLKQAFRDGGAMAYWQKRLEHSRQDLAKGIGSSYKIAACLARLGEPDAAIEHLERSFAAREPDLIWIRTESAFDGLSQDERFDELLRRIGVKS